MKILKILVAVLLVALVAGLGWLYWLFDEDVAEVHSLTSHTGAKRLLAVVAHPDDEQLVAGLLLRASAEDGVVTAVYTATPGDRGTPLPQISRIEDMGHVRRAEALKNTWALGVDHHLVDSFQDGRVPEVPEAELVAAVRAQFLQYRPDLLVTFWPESGFSDHGDHKRMGEIATRLAGEFRASPVDGYAGPNYIAYGLAPAKVMAKFGGEAGARVVANQPAPNISQGAEGWAKIRGWKIHASQEDYIQHAYGLPPWLIHRIWDREYYFLKDMKNDH